MLKQAGENIASVVGHLERVAPAILQIIPEYLQTVVPMVHGLERKQVGPMETLEFRQDMAGSKHPWRFLSRYMSDGTLRALGVLVALFQGNRDYAPTLVGIEEPETALHSAASAALREALVRASAQTRSLSPATAQPCWTTRLTFRRSLNAFARNFPAVGRSG